MPNWKTMLGIGKFSLGSNHKYCTDRMIQEKIDGFENSVGMATEEKDRLLEEIRVRQALVEYLEDESYDDLDCVAELQAEQQKRQKIWTLRIWTGDATYRNEHGDIDTLLDKARESLERGQAIRVEFLAK